MYSVEILVGVVGLMIALWQLNLQKREIIKNGKINSLIHISSMLQAKSDYHDKIINDKRQRNEKWKGHADKVNDELRPLKNDVDDELLNLIALYENMPNVRTIRDQILSNNSGS
tara:strand:+ start:288 stop:629 length:342 start_codon:yes stop_codon:yes gene_type:complete